MRILFIALFIAIPSFIFAQSNYHEGYIVKNNGDTLKGFIDYREWEQSPLFINFKVSKSDKEQRQFTPDSIRGFGIDTTESYISYQGQMSMDQNHFPDLAEGLDTRKVDASVFLKLVTSGKYLLLYSQSDQRKTRYFVAEVKSKPVELIYNQYYNSQHESVERSIFRGQLIFYINKYAPLNSNLIKDVEQTAFENDQLAKIVYKTNGDTAVSVNGHVIHSDIQVFVGLGLLYSKASSDHHTGAYNASPLFTIGFDKFYNSTTQQIVFRASFSVGSAGLQVPYPISGPSNNALKFNQFTFCATPQIIYHLYNNENFKVHIGAGPSLNFSSYSNEIFTNPYISESGSADGVPKLDPFWVSIPLQAGVTIHKRFEFSFTYTPYSSIVTNGTLTSLSIGSIDFGAKIYLK